MDSTILNCDAYLVLYSFPQFFTQHMAKGPGEPDLPADKGPNNRWVFTEKDQVPAEKNTLLFQMSILPHNPSRSKGARPHKNNLPPMPPNL